MYIRQAELFIYDAVSNGKRSLGDLPESYNLLIVQTEVCRLSVCWRRYKRKLSVCTRTKQACPSVHSNNTLFRVFLSEKSIFLCLVNINHDCGPCRITQKEISCSGIRAICRALPELTLFRLVPCPQWRCLLCNIGNRGQSSHWLSCSSVLYLDCWIFTG
jgi:hypothetical protein